MKVILLQDVAKVGRRFDVAEVANGHALNKLIPNGIAKPATKENLKQVEALKAKGQADAEAVDATFGAALEALKDKEIVITKEANESGHLYEAIKESAVVEALAAVGATVLENQIHIGKPIKEVGAHSIELHSGEQKTEVSIEVVAA